MKLGKRKEINSLGKFSDVECIILGLNPTGLGVLQALGQRGVKLIGIDTNRFEIGFFSRFGEKIVSAQDGLLNCLLKIGKANKQKILLFPTSDEYLLLVSQNETVLGRYFLFPFPKNDLVEKLLNKYDFFLLVSQYTNDIPKCCLPESEDIKQWNLWPVIIKPVFIHEFRKIFPNQKAWVVKNRDEIEKKLQLAAELKLEVFVQEIVESPDYEQYSVCVYIDKQKVPQKVMVSRKVRQSPPGFGVGTFVEMLSDKMLVERTLRLLKDIGFSGIAEVEYRKDDKDGKFKIIEINSRVWTQSKLASYGGVDIIGAAYNDHLGKSLKPMTGHASKWFFLIRDMETCVTYLKNRNIRFSELVNSYKKMKQHVGAVWNIYDPFPTLALPFYVGWKLKVHMKKHRQ